MVQNSTLESLVDDGTMKLILEQSSKLDFAIEQDRLVLKGVRYSDGSINLDLASRLLKGVLYVHDGKEPELTLIKKTMHNSKGQPSGELIINLKTGNIIGGYGWVNWQSYNIIPMNHPSDTNSNWKLDETTRSLWVMNSFSPEYAQSAVTEAQIKYDISNKAA